MNWFTPRHYDDLHKLLTELTEKVDKMAIDLSKLTTDVAALKTAVGAAITDLGALSADIAALKAQIASNPTDPTVQAAVDALDQSVTGITGDLTTATAANPA